MAKEKGEGAPEKVKKPKPAKTVKETTVKVEQHTTAPVAWLNIQKEIPTIVKDTQGDGYKYTTLDSIMNIVKPILNKHGFTVGWENDELGVSCLATYTDGSVIETGPMPFPTPYPTDPRSAGSWHTYLRRYTLCALLGIVTEADTDGGLTLPAPSVPGSAVIKDRTTGEVITPKESVFSAPPMNTNPNAPEMARKTSAAALEKAIMEATPERLKTQQQKLTQDYEALQAGKKTVFGLSAEDYGMLLVLIEDRMEA